MYHENFVQWKMELEVNSLYWIMKKQFHFKRNKQGVPCWLAIETLPLNNCSGLGFWNLHIYQMQKIMLSYDLYHHHTLGSKISMEVNLFKHIYLLQRHNPMNWYFNSSLDHTACSATYGSKNMHFMRSTTVCLFTNFSFISYHSWMFLQSKLINIVHSIRSAQ